MSLAMKKNSLKKKKSIDLLGLVNIYNILESKQITHGLVKGMTPEECMRYI